MYVYIYLYIHIYSMCTCTHIYTHNFYICIYTFIQINICIYTCVYILFVYIYVYICICMYASRGSDLGRRIRCLFNQRVSFSSVVLQIVKTEATTDQCCKLALASCDVLLTCRKLAKNREKTSVSFSTLHLMSFVFIYLFFFSFKHIPVNLILI